MFKGDKNKANVDSPERLNRLVTGTKLEGNLTTESSLRVDGLINGDVQCSGKIVLGTEGVIVGNLVSTQAEIEGNVEGDLKVEDLLILQKTAIVKGAIQTGRLVIEDGAQIGGNVSTGDLPQVSNTSKKSKNNDANNAPEESDVVY
jgi:cytoskeletal protein CcmA (bactofilin family)